MINVLDFIFLNLAFTVTLTGVLIKKFRNHIPAFIIKGFNYGSFAYAGSDARFLDALEIPKSYYRHFYLFSSIFSTITLMYMYLVYFINFSANYYFCMLLEAILKQDNSSVSVTAALIVMSLLVLQCSRRFYETYCLQVFAKSSKMNFSHYLAGMVHYFACIVGTVGSAPLFCGTQNREEIIWSDAYTNILALPCIAIFLWAWIEQYKTNIIFANLRKDKKSGDVVTEDHKIPNGRLFEKVSSPHRLCEIILYTMLIVLMPTKTFFCIYLWVLSNQTQTAIQAHDWYLKSFKNYPTIRKALIPGIL